MTRLCSQAQQIGHGKREASGVTCASVSDGCGLLFRRFGSGWSFCSGCCCCCLLRSRSCIQVTQ